MRVKYGDLNYKDQLRSREIQFYTDDDVILALALRNERRKTTERDKEENFGQTRLGRLRKTLWDLFEYPASSRGAKVCTELRKSLCKSC